MSLLINICVSNVRPSQMPANVNEAVGFIKKAGRNMLLTIERPDVTGEQGNHHLSGSKIPHDNTRVPESGRECQELQHGVWRGPEPAPDQCSHLRSSVHIFTTLHHIRERRRLSDRRSSWRPDRRALPRRRGGSR